MSIPVLQSSVPANSETGVALNVVLKVTFDVAIDPATVIQQVFQIWNSKFNQRVQCDLALSSDRKTLAATPLEFLFPDCAHRMRVIGTDVNARCLKSATGDSLATTITIVFQTGNDLDVPADEKSSDEIAAEGDAILPDDFGLKSITGSPLRLISTTPGHNSFKIAPDVTQIGFRFSANVDPSTVTGSVLVNQIGFYDEDRLRARETDLGKGAGLRHYFMSETGFYNDPDVQGYLDPALFADRTYEIVISGAYVYLVFDDTYSFPKNVALEVTLGGALGDAAGNVLGDDLVWFGCVEPYPSWSSLLDIKHGIGMSVAAQVTDTFIGMRIWRNTIDLLRRTDWDIPTDNPTGPMREYVRAKSGIDVWDDLLATKALASGTSKRLGDLEVTVNTAAGSARPSSVRKFDELISVLELNIFGGMTQSPRIGIRSIMDPYEPGREFFHDRLWKAEISLSRQAQLWEKRPMERDAGDSGQSGSPLLGDSRWRGRPGGIGGAGSYHAGMS